MEERHGQTAVGRTRRVVPGEGQGDQGGVVPVGTGGERSAGYLGGQERSQEIKGICQEDDWFRQENG